MQLQEGKSSLRSPPSKGPSAGFRPSSTGFRAKSPLGETRSSASYWLCEPGNWRSCSGSVFVTCGTLARWLGSARSDHTQGSPCATSFKATPLCTSVTDSELWASGLGLTSAPDGRPGRGGRLSRPVPSHREAVPYMSLSLSPAKPINKSQEIKLESG